MKIQAVLSFSPFKSIKDPLRAIVFSELTPRGPGGVEGKGGEGKGKGKKCRYSIYRGKRRKGDGEGRG